MSNSAKPTYTLPADAVWLITGCSSGVGLALARLIAAHPTQRLAATARASSRLAALLPSHARVLLLELDVTSAPSVARALDTVLAHPGFGRIDVLVNNAGYGLSGDTETSLPPSAAATTTPPSLLSEGGHAKARALVETNFWGVAHLTLQAMRIMREINALPDENGGGRQGGVVVQISSMGGFVGYPGLAWYNAAKFAVEGFTESVSREVRPEWNIHFTIAEPGGIDTPCMGSNMVHLAPHPAYEAPDSPSRLLAAYSENPESFKSYSKPENIAQAIHEIVSRGKEIPIRIPLGGSSWEMLRREIARMAEEFDAIKELSFSVDNDEIKQAEQAKTLQNLI